MPVSNNLADWFSLAETPTAGSPVGRLIPAVIEKNPGMTFEDARAVASTLLLQAAGRKVYRVPRVFSPAEKEAARERMKTAFGVQKAA